MTINADYSAGYQPPRVVTLYNAYLARQRKMVTNISDVDSTSFSRIV